MICTLAFVLSLYGCQLAKEDAEQGLDDKLVGVFITTEYLDLFDFESYLNDNVSQFMNGGEVIIDDASGQYDGRIYATRKTVSLTSDETGETIAHDEFVFERLDGMAFFAAEVPQTETAESYKTNHADEGVSDVHFSVDVSDTQTKEQLEGTVYVAQGGAGVYYFNPVYQSGDGSIYVISGSGMSMSDGMIEGAAFSQTIEDTRTTLKNGETITESLIVKISVTAIQAPEMVVIVQMDAANAPISRMEYNPYDMPDMITPQPTTAYCIIESHSTDADGSAAVSRTVAGRTENSFTSWYARDDGVCVAKSVNVRWELGRDYQS